MYRTALIEMNRIECTDWNTYKKMHILRCREQLADQHEWKDMPRSDCMDKDPYNKLHKQDGQIQRVEYNP